MAETTTLTQRIQAEFDAVAQKRKAATELQAQEAQERDAGVARFEQVCGELSGVWKPRIEEFAKKFGESVKVTPTVTRGSREAKVAFLTDMATMTLTLTATLSPDVKQLVLTCELFIVPIYFEYERSARLEVPLDAVDKDAIGKWFDDRLIACVRAYLTMQETKVYIERAMVEDPMTKAKFLKEEAKETFEHEGRKLYFASAESLKAYKEKQRLGEFAPKETAPEPVAGAAPKNADGPAETPTITVKPPAVPTAKV